MKQIFEKDKPTIGGVHVAFIAMWIAILLAVSAVPAYPIPGIPGSITVASALSAGLTAPLMGPWAGLVAGLVYGLLAVTLFPYTAFFGLLTALCPFMGFFIGGLTLYNKWKWAGGVFAVLLAVWFTHPFAWENGMPLVAWEQFVALGIILIPPIRKWVIDSVVERDPKRMILALSLLGWVSRMGDVTTGNILAVRVIEFTIIEYWVPMIPYYAITDSLTCLLGAVVGSAVLVALKRVKIKMAVDVFEPVWKGRK